MGTFVGKKLTKIYLTCGATATNFDAVKRLFSSSVTYDIGYFVICK